jgi:RND family efflux transporter MFP subunit
VEETVAVRVATVELSLAQDLRIASGAVEPWQRVSPGTKILGRISTVTVDVGDRVETGQLLSRLEDADLQASLEQARAAVAIAETRLVTADSQYRRMTQLEQRGSATARSLEDATSAFQIARASLQQARANLAAAEAALLYSEVRSPVPGLVVEKNVEAGDMARPGQPFFTIENTSRVKITAQVAESDIVDLREGDQARIEIPVLRLIEPATVSRIAPAADTASRTFDVEVHLDNPEGAIKSGMFARISFPQAERKALLVPTGSIVKRGQLEGIFVIDQGRARLRWLRLGRTTDDQTEVLSGLEPGEVFVLSVPERLADGSKVDTTQ